MRKIIFAIAYYWGSFFHYLCNSHVALIWSMIQREFHTGWLQKEFKSFGKGAVVDRPITLLNPRFISVGKNVLLGRKLVLTAWDQHAGANFSPEIIIGDNSEIGDESHITCINKIIIGKGVLTGKKVLITDNSHGEIDRENMDVAPQLREPVSKGLVIIEDNVWIGEKASIMPGVTIGKGAIIGANSVVTKDIPAYSLAVGCPAKVIKHL
mgnify:CR=1 FL=1